LAAAINALRDWSRTARACLLWLIGYAVLYHSWQPFTMVYRITDLLAFWLLLAIFAQSARWKTWSLAAWVTTAGIFNGIFLILPQLDPGRNAYYQEALRVSQQTPPDAWIVVKARDQVYIPYFAGRKPFNLRYYKNRTEALAQRLDEIGRAGQPVYITGVTLRLSGLQDFFRDYGIKAETEAPGEELYRIARKGNPSGKSLKKLKSAPAAKKGPNGTGSDMRKLPRTTRPMP
jgi:hypothetical protein